MIYEYWMLPWLLGYLLYEYIDLVQQGAIRKQKGSG